MILLPLESVRVPKRLQELAIHGNNVSGTLSMAEDDLLSQNVSFPGLVIIYEPNLCSLSPNPGLVRGWLLASLCLVLHASFPHSAFLV